jgi:hypothetical protein
MRLKHARYARGQVVFRGRLVSRDVLRAAAREAFWWFSRAAGVLPAKAQARHLRILRAGRVMGAAGHTHGKLKKGRKR